MQHVSIFLLPWKELRNVGPHYPVLILLCQPGILNERFLKKLDCHSLHEMANFFVIFIFITGIPEYIWLCGMPISARSPRVGTMNRSLTYS